MAQEYDQKVLELEMVLRKFRLEHFERYIIPEFPETSWSIVTRIIKRTKRPLSSRWIALVITSAVKEARISPEEVSKRTNICRTYLLALFETKEWHAYRLEDKLDGVIVTSSTMAGRITRSLRSELGSRGYRFESTFVTYDDSVYIRVLMRKTGGVGELSIISRPNIPLALFSKHPSKLILDEIVQGLGYSTCKDMKLSGKHVKSLLRMGSKKETTIVEQLVEREPYIKRPRVLERGIDFSNADSALDYADSLLGPEPYKLGKFGFTCVAPFYNSDIIDSDVKFEIRMESEDIAASLRDMVEANALAADSLLITAYNMTKTNVINFQTLQN